MNAEGITKLYEAGIAEGYARALAEVQELVSACWPHGQYESFNEYQLQRGLTRMMESAAEEQEKNNPTKSFAIENDDDSPVSYH